MTAPPETFDAWRDRLAREQIASEERDLAALPAWQTRLRRATAERIERLRAGLRETSQMASPSGAALSISVVGGGCVDPTVNLRPESIEAPAVGGSEAAGHENVGRPTTQSDVTAGRDRHFSEAR